MTVPVFRFSYPVAALRACAAVATVALLLGAAAPALAESPAADPVVAIVNGTEIRDSDVRLADEIVGRNLPTHDMIERRDSLLKMLIDSTLLAQVANERKIVDEADVQRRVSYARNQGLMNHLLAVVAQEAVTEESIQKAYQDVVVKAADNEPEVHLRHLVFLFKTPKDEAAVKAAEEKAEAALKRIKNGDDFAAVVAEMSEDPVTKARGGDFGWRTRPEMGKEYADLAFTMRTGDVSPLIKTGVGWHIVKLEDRRNRKPIELDKIHDRVAALVATAAQFDLVEKARAKANIQRMDGSGAATTNTPKD
jgi:peptidyl-prolyl cis-trans isomerase C